jgi:hypothetical protein
MPPPRLGGALNDCWRGGGAASKDCWRGGGVLREDCCGIPVERSLTRGATLGLARAMLGFVRVAPGFVRGTAYDGADARLRAACDMPPPLRGAALWPGCVRALSVDAVGLVRAMLGLLRVAPGLVRGATFDGVVVR